MARLDAQNMRWIDDEGNEREITFDDFMTLSPQERQSFLQTGGHALYPSSGFDRTPGGVAAANLRAVLSRPYSVDPLTPQQLQAVLEGMDPAFAQQVAQGFPQFLQWQAEKNAKVGDSGLGAISDAIGDVTQPISDFMNSPYAPLALLAPFALTAMGIPAAAGASAGAGALGAGELASLVGPATGAIEAAPVIGAAGAPTVTGIATGAGAFMPAAASGGAFASGGATAAGTGAETAGALDSMVGPATGTVESAPVIGASGAPTVTGIATGGGPFLPASLSAFGSQAVDLGKKLLGGDTSALNQLLKLGVPIATLAGLFEENESPLLGPMKDAAKGALRSAGAFEQLPTPGITPSQQRAIQVANSSVGDWKPYIDKAAAGIPGLNLNDYMNPYIKSALDPAAKEIERTAANKRVTNNARAQMRGAFGGSRASVEQGALDRAELEAVGDLYKTGYSQAFDRATSLGTTDLNRNFSIGGNVGAFAGRDVDMLKEAGALERIPYEDQRAKLADQTKLYTGVVHGTSPALEPTTPTSTLTNVAGALGTIKSAKDLELF